MLACCRCVGDLVWLGCDAVAQSRAGRRQRQPRVHRLRVPHAQPQHVRQSDRLGERAAGREHRTQYHGSRAGTVRHDASLRHRATRSATQISAAAQDQRCLLASIYSFKGRSRLLRAPSIQFP